MDTKNNIRSIRFSDELAELIERQQGENFTQKFENLVYRCAWELPAKEPGRDIAALRRRSISGPADISEPRPTAGGGSVIFTRRKCDGRGNFINKGRPARRTAPGVLC